MPLHDWTRVDDGIFHDFHLGWIAEMRRALNNGLLPEGYYALGEQITTEGNLDVLALHVPYDDDDDTDANGEAGGDYSSGSGGTALMTVEPRTRLVTKRKSAVPAKRRIAVRHVSDDRIVAAIELISSGNKSSSDDLKQLVNKANALIRSGIHLLIVDLYPPTRREPQGIHGAIWSSLFSGESFVMPTDADRLLVSYAAFRSTTAYIEPVAVGQALKAMPLYLSPAGYIEVPLEETYMASYASVPHKYRRILDEMRTA